MKKMIAAPIAMLICLMAFSGCMQVPDADEKPSQITVTNFEECVAAGNPVMESYPRQCRANGKTFVEEISEPVVLSTMTEEEAKLIAEQICIKGGEALTSGGTYNPNSKTWWFDANLNATQEGCNPACVVSELTKTAEINWRCTGLILPEENQEGNPEVNGPETEAAIKQLFVEKYPEYADTLAIDVMNETATHARGGIIFVEGQPGGIFLASKTSGDWEIVQDGNGAIPCTLKDQGFPADMIPDCYE